mgnify:CR=1 FL=1
MKMKTINKIAAALVLISSHIIPHAFADETKTHKTVFIASIVEHPALDNIKKGVEDTQQIVDAIGHIDDLVFIATHLIKH